MTDFDSARLEAEIGARCPRAKVMVRDTVETTQDPAFQLAEYGAAHGSVVVADEQTAGRGRRGRDWVSPPGKGLWCSLVLRPTPPGPAPTLLVAAVAVAAATALESIGARARVRWPNDLLIEGRKVAGLLLETRDFDPRAPLFILGAGINTALLEEDLPEDLRPLVTSVQRETGSAPNRHDLLLALHGEIMDACERSSSAPSEVESDYRDRAAHLGEAVSLLDGSTPRTGILRDVSPVSGVVLEEASGTMLTVKAEHAREIRRAGPDPGLEGAPRP